MRVLIGYSTCSLTQAAFEANPGVEAWTCDLRPADHARHLQCDIWEVCQDPIWDIGVFHPMCTYLTNAAAWAYMDPDYEKYPEVGYHLKTGPEVLKGAERREARAEAVENFKRLWKLRYPKALENPAAGALSSAFRRPTQVVHPYHFGDDASKATGLWLDRLPKLPLDPRLYVPPVLMEYRGKTVRRWANQAPCGAPKAPRTDDRWLLRSKTWPGIAKAFGETWGAVRL